MTWVEEACSDQKEVQVGKEAEGRGKGEVEVHHIGVGKDRGEGRAWLVLLQQSAIRCLG